MRSLPIAVLLLVGCTAPLKEELNRSQDEVRGLEEEFARIEAENSRLTVLVADLERDLEAFRAAGAAGLDPTVELWAELDTSMGNVLCRLEPARVPATVANFVSLAEGTRKWTDPRTGRQSEAPLYNGTIFHRVMPGFMIQGGDPLGTGLGGPGYTFEDEFHPALRHEPGTLSMANSGADTNGSQFFITQVATPHLDGVHSVFGHCEPMSLIEDIANVPLRPAEQEGEDPTRPVADIVLEMVTIHRGAKPQPGD